MEGSTVTIPNSITRIIDKHGKIVPFDLSKIYKSIATAITYIEHVKEWEAESRAIKYSELVQKRIFDNFYNLNALIKDALNKINSFDQNERSERILRSDFCPRLTSLLCQTCLDQLNEFDQLDPKGQDTFWSENSQPITMVRDLFTNNHKKLPYLEEVINGFYQKIQNKARLGFTEYDYYPDREFIQDMIELELKAIGEVCVAEGFMIYREGRNKIKTGEISKTQFTHDGIHRETLQSTLLWNIKHECDSVFGLNDWILGKNGKSLKELMDLSDERFYADIEQVVEKILKRKNQLKIVIIAGPSCSNKTTTTAILSQKLQKRGLKLKQLNVDDYFLSLSAYPKDEFGDYDFETPDALELDLLNNNLQDLTLGKTIQKPIYNFKLGKRDGIEEFSVQNDELILIDCLHGLYRKTTESVPTDKKFKIFVEPQNVLRNTDGSYTKWTDIRLLKRMIRDHLYRNYDPKKTLAHWTYVRKGELKHIIPYIYAVDEVINTGLPYELPVLKTSLQEIFPSLIYIENLRREGRLDPYIRGVRTSTLLDTIIRYDYLEEISPISPIREFIGGSAYEIRHNE